MSRVLSIGVALPGNAAEYVPFKSDRALFDADIIIFSPTFQDYTSEETYRGCPLICEDESPTIVQDCNHWKTELTAAAEAGKIVFVILYKPVQVYYDTGVRTHSGTGRNRATTREVAEKMSYDSIPVALAGLTARGGSEIAVLNAGPIAPYWSQFGQDSSYEVYFNYNDAGLLALLATKNRERVVGALSRRRNGAFVLLPPPKWDEASLSYKKGEQEYWNKKGVAFGERFVAALIDTARTLQREGARSLVPEWAAGAQYCSKLEERCQERMEDIDAQTSALAKMRRRTPSVDLCLVPCSVC